MLHPSAERNEGDERGWHVKEDIGHFRFLDHGDDNSNHLPETTNSAVPTGEGMAVTDTLIIYSGRIKSTAAYLHECVKVG